MNILKDHKEKHSPSWNTKPVDFTATQILKQESNIDEILKCFICLQRVKNAQMCPFCSKLCCSACISKWLTEQKPQCPHCRSPLRISQLVNCRFVSEITLVI
jgi:tripartite motif-containing protein 37